MRKALHKGSLFFTIEIVSDKLHIAYGDTDKNEYKTYTKIFPTNILSESKHSLLQKEFKRIVDLKLKEGYVYPNIEIGHIPYKSTETKYKTIEYPFFIQPYINQHKCLLRKIGKKIIFTFLKETFEIKKWFDFDLDSNIILDGYLFIGTMSSSRIKQNLRTGKVSKRFHEKIKFYYHDIYDIENPDLEAYERLAIINSYDFKKRTLKCLPTIIVNDDKELAEVSKTFNSVYDGSLIKTFNSLYLPNISSRTAYIYRKNKELTATIIGYKASYRQLLWKCESEETGIFYCHNLATVKLKKDIEQYIGEEITVKYRQLQKNGKAPLRSTMKVLGVFK